MYKIVVCCYAGMTSHLLVQAMKTAAKEKDIPVMIWSVAETALDQTWADADCVLVAPQAVGYLEQINTMIQGKVPVQMIDEKKFVNMDGEAILELAIGFIENKG